MSQEFVEKRLDEEVEKIESPEALQSLIESIKNGTEPMTALAAAQALDRQTKAAKLQAEIDARPALELEAARAEVERLEAESNRLTQIPEYRWVAEDVRGQAKKLKQAQFEARQNVQRLEAGSREDGTQDKLEALRAEHENLANTLSQKSISRVTPEERGQLLELRRQIRELEHFARWGAPRRSV